MRTAGIKTKHWNPAAGTGQTRVNEDEARLGGSASRRDEAILSTSILAKRHDRQLMLANATVLSIPFDITPIITPLVTMASVRILWAV
jgi:hypothetical protein